MIDPSLLATVDDVRISFSETSVWILDVVIAGLLFGIALDVDPADFRGVWRRPAAPLVGLTCHYVLMPAATFGLTQLLDLAPSVALGMLLIASCPGGNLSNILVHLAKGNTALSVGISATSSAVAVAITPLSLSFWASLDEDTERLFREVTVSPLRMLATIALILGVPVVAAQLLRKRRPERAAALVRPMRIATLVVFVLFLCGAVLSNLDPLREHLDAVLLAVALENGTALALGYWLARAARLAPRDARAVSIEVGIRNAALGLVLVFAFFDGLGGMALVAAWYGIYHLISGGSLAAFWSRRPPRPAPAPA